MMIADDEQVVEKAMFKQIPIPQSAIRLAILLAVVVPVFVLVVGPVVRRYVIDWNVGVDKPHLI